MHLLAGKWLRTPDFDERMQFAFPLFCMREKGRGKESGKFGPSVYMGTLKCFSSPEFSVTLSPPLRPSTSASTFSSSSSSCHGLWRRSFSVSFPRPFQLLLILGFLLLSCRLPSSLPAMASTPTKKTCACRPPCLPSPPPASPLLSFLQRIQSSALSILGSNSSSFDPKTYVDLPLRFSLNRTVTAFDRLPRSCNGTISPDIFQRFVKEYFHEAGSDLQPHTPDDYTPEPKNFLPDVEDKQTRAWALKVHAIWLELAKKVAGYVEQEPDQHTLLPLPNPVIVPGSRFREVYYWDSYWIIRGLIVSKMFDTAKGMVENLLHMVQLYGFVLNGARAYYENRSQPPLLSAMVREVYSATGDVHFLEKALPILIREHKYWTSDPKKVTIMDGKGHKHSLSRYYADWEAPRPESFTIDIQVAAEVPFSERQSLYHDIASAAESGWDFSSRWMRDQETLSKLFTSSIIPADLNSYLFQMETNIAFMADIVGNATIYQKFNKAAHTRSLAIESILWNDDMGQWVDYKLNRDDCQIKSNRTVYIWNKNSQNKIITASNFIPLWTGVLRSGDSKVTKVVKALNHSGLICSAGIATTLKGTGQQWDFPNAWPPLQHMIIEGLVLSGSQEGYILAKSVAQSWIQTNYAVFEKTEHMLEKYNATECGGTGGGGEYNLQTGFGWSNGVLLSLLNDFGWSLSISATC